MLDKFQSFLKARPLPVLLAGAFGLLYLRTFIFPGTPIYQGDNAPVFLLEAARMLHGQAIYRDFFELTFPGMPALYLLLFKIFGVRAWVPAFVLVAQGVGITCLGAYISKRVAGGANAYLPSVVFLAFAMGNALDATHHWMSILSALGALAVLIERRTSWRVCAAGGLCGIATFFTQSRGVMALLACGAFLYWESRTKKLGGRRLLEKCAALSSGFLATILCLLAYFVWTAGMRRFIFCTFVFVAKYYSYFDRNNLGVYMVDVPLLEGWLEVPAVAIWLFVHLLVPLVYLLFLAHYWRNHARSPQEPWDRLMLVNFMGLAFFLSIASAPNWFKIASSTLPAMIILAWFLNSPGNFLKYARRTLWVAGLAVAIVTPFVTQTDWHRELDTPTGRISFLDSERFEKFNWFSNHTRRGEYIFEAGDTDLYFPLALQNPTSVAFLTQTNYTRPEQVRLTIAALERRHVSYVLWSPWLDAAQQDRLPGDNLGPLREYLTKSYHVIKTFMDGDQVWGKTTESRNQ